MSKENKGREVYSWDGFNGTLEEWAWYTLKEMDLPSCMEYQDIEREIQFRELLKTKAAFEKCQAENQELKLQLADRSEKYRIAMDKGVMQLSDEIQKLKKQLAVAVKAVSRIRGWAEDYPAENSVIENILDTSNDALKQIEELNERTKEINYG